MIKAKIKIATYIIFVASYLIFSSGLTIAATSVSVLPSAQEVGPGDEFSLEIHVKPDTPIYGLQLDLKYDNSLVTINNIEEGNLFANSGSPVMFNPGEIDESTETVSQIYGAVIMGDGITDEGIFCTIDLVAQSNYGPCQLRITNLVLGDKQGKKLASTTFDSIINVRGTSDTVGEIKNKSDDEKESLPDNERNTVSSENEEHIFASTPIQAEESNVNKETIPEFDNSKISNWAALILIAITFFGIAYFLDRKK